MRHTCLKFQRAPALPLGPTGHSAALAGHDVVIGQDLRSDVRLAQPVRVADTGVKVWSQNVVRDSIPRVKRLHGNCRRRRDTTLAKRRLGDLPSPKQFCGTSPASTGRRAGRALAGNYRVRGKPFD